MTDLTGPDLVLAVARVLKKDSLPITILGFGGKKWVVSERLAVIADRLVLPEGSTGSIVRIGWRSDLGGAAGAEVLDFARSKFGEVILRSERDMDGELYYVCVLNDEYDGEWNCHICVPDSEGSDWIALCRAVIAWGESTAETR